MNCMLELAEYYADYNIDENNTTTTNNIYIYIYIYINTIDNY